MNGCRVHPWLVKTSTAGVVYEAPARTPAGQPATEGRVRGKPLRAVLTRLRREMATRVRWPIVRAFHRYQRRSRLQRRANWGKFSRKKGMEEQESLFTATEDAEVAPTPNAGARGVLWVHPQVRFTPFEDEITIGRVGSGAEWELASAEASRSHAKLTKTGPSWLLTDLESKNGTWVNARRVESVTLFDQDIVRVGECVGVVTALAAATITPFVEITPSWRVGPTTARTVASIVALSRSDVPIIVCGETGTGKDVVASAIHQLSGRPGKFVALNCATIAEAIAEAQLFGHRRGAFTGAVNDAEGLFAAADGGTLFLDEVGDLPASIQAKLLRVIEAAAFTPLGTSRPQRSNVRILAACQEGLDKLVARGAFRGDLFARLNGSELRLAPLRARKEEILYLLGAFLVERNVFAKPSAQFVERLLCYDYPYNVRELVQLARVLANHNPERLLIEHLPQRFDASRPPDDRQAPNEDNDGATPLKGRRASWLIRHARELASLQSVLNCNGWNVSDAARELNIPRHRALRLLAAHKALRT